MTDTSNEAIERAIQNALHGEWPETTAAILRALRAERDRMKKALQEIEDPPSMVFDIDDGCGVCAWMSNRAEDALKGDDQ
jgi:hypothetical protein